MHFKTLSHFLLFLTALAAIFTSPVIGQSTSIVVTNTNNNGTGSLRRAVANARSGTTITFAAALQGRTIKLNGTELLLTKNITIDGTNRNITIDANRKSRVFRISNNAEVKLIGLTITRGNTPHRGGGVYVNGTCKLMVAGCMVTDNTSQAGGGGIFNSGTLYLVNSVIAHNKSTESNGGGIWHDGMATITNCTITENSAVHGGGGIRIWDSGTMVINNTIVTNSSLPDIKMHVSGRIQGSNNLTSFTDWGKDSGDNVLYTPTKPLFIEAAKDYYRLAPGSQAINQGRNDKIPVGLTKDITGDDRIVHSTVDIGAYEYGRTLAEYAPIVDVVELDSRKQLKIYGTQHSDWVEIEETATHIVVHTFNENREKQLRKWTFTKNEIAKIEFYGNDGNDTFVGAYNDTPTSVACTLWGGTGNNSLTGGDANDWIYGGEGNNILDGGKGDNIIIGGHGQNTFCNQGEGSNCYIWAGYNNKWDEGHAHDRNDGFIIARDTDARGNNPYKYRQWTEIELLGIGYAVRDAYGVTGGYAVYYYRQSTPLYFAIVDGSLPDYPGGAWAWGSQLSFTHLDRDSYPWAFYHELGHTFQYDENLFWNEFKTISWNPDGTIKKDAIVADFVSPTSGITMEELAKGSVVEEWAGVVNEILWPHSGGVPKGRSDKYYQKVDLILKFIHWLNSEGKGSTIVTTLEDTTDISDQFVSLREAIHFARQGNTITFSNSLRGQTIKLNGTELLLSKNITIDGTNRNITIDADRKSRVFNISNNAEVILVGLTITGGNTSHRGGGAANYGKSLTIINTTVSDNSANEGGGLYSQTDGNLTIIDSIVTGNASQGGGAGIFNDGDMHIVNSVISSNKSQGDAAGIWHGYTATITNSTITGNTAPDGGGGIRTWGKGTMVINNSIVAQNSSSPDIKMHISGRIQGSNNLTSFTDWGSNSGGNITYDSARPLFIDAANGNYRLAAGAQAIDSGNNALAVDDKDKPLQKDFDGNPRFVNRTVDIGVYEHCP